MSHEELPQGAEHEPYIAEVERHLTAQLTRTLVGLNYLAEEAKIRDAIKKKQDIIQARTPDATWTLFDAILYAKPIMHARAAYYGARAASLLNETFGTENTDPIGNIGDQLI